MKILIIGGSGFIGKSLCSRLCNSGLYVTTISRSPIPALHKRHKHEDLTLDNTHEIKKLVKSASYIFHLASDTTPGSSKLQPSLEANNNIFPTFRLLELLQDIKSPPIIYCSSGGAIYNTNASSPYDESSQLKPISYYGAGKLAIENFFSAYSHQTKNPAIILRPSNVYGPGQRTKKQFGVIPTIFNSISKNLPFEIWGSGEDIRDYIYIEDFLDLCFLIIQRKWERETLETYNVGSGIGHSIIDICNISEKTSKKKLNKIFMPSRGIDNPITILNCKKATSEFNWKAKTPLKKGLESTWSWIERDQA